MLGFVLKVGVGIPGAFWRAAFVAALALIAFVIARYWKSFAEYSKADRYLFGGVRGVALLIVACALVGMQIEYEKEPPLQILIYPAKESFASEVRERAYTEATKKIISSLTNNDIEFIDQDTLSSTNDKYPAASIFVTDGSMESATASAEVERAHVASGGGPVFVISELDLKIGAQVSINDIAVGNRPMRGVPLTVRCTMHAKGMKGRSTLVTVSDDAQVRASVEARWSGDDERQMLTVEVMPKTAGWINYSIRAEGVHGEDLVMTSRPFTIFVEERRQRVLFFEGEPTWEAKFIRRVLDKSDLFDVDYFAQISRTAITGAKTKQTGTENELNSKSERNSTEHDLRTALASIAKLNSYDCIIIGATSDLLISKAEATRLLAWVEGRGGGLIILGGNDFAGSVVAPNGKLSSLMPADIDSSSFRSAAQTLALSTPVEAENSRVEFSLTPTEAGQNGALRGYAKSLEASEGAAGVLTGEGFRLGHLRPGATVLAVKSQPVAKGSAEVGEPLVVSMRYGSGLAVVFAPADSWRMRTGESGDESENNGPFASLWQGLSLWAASSARPPVEIVLSNESPESKRETIAEIRVLDAEYTPTRIEKLSGRIQLLDDDGRDESSATPPAEVLFFPDPNDPNIWRAKFDARIPGRYDLQVDYTTNGKSATAEKYFATVVASPIEPGASSDTLRRVSRDTGGEMFNASSLTSLRERLAALSNTRPTVRRKLGLHTWWPLGIFIPLLLSSVWLIERIRARVRLPVNGS